MQKDGQYLLNLLPGMIIGFFTIGDEYPGIIAKDGQGWIFERDVINPRPITQSEVVERGGTDETADAAAELLTPDEWTWLEEVAAGQDSKKNGKSLTPSQAKPKSATTTADFKMRARNQINRVTFIRQ